MTTFHGMTKKDTVLHVNTDNERKFLHKTQLHMTSPEEVFPEYFLLMVNHFNEVARTPIEEWMQYLKDAVIREDTTAPGLQAAREKLAYMSMTPKQRRAYEDYMISVHAARDAWETLRDESRAEGEAIGEEKARRKNALKMKADKMPVELIAKYTGLTAEEIEAL